MAQTPDIKIVRMTGLFGTCRSITVYRDGVDIGGAELSAGERGGPLWYISAGGGTVEKTIRFDPKLTNEENLAAVELTLRLAVSAADALSNSRAA